MSKLLCALFMFITSTSRNDMRIAITELIKIKEKWDGEGGGGGKEREERYKDEGEAIKRKIQKG